MNIKNYSEHIEKSWELFNKLGNPKYMLAPMVD